MSDDYVPVFMANRKVFETPLLKTEKEGRQMALSSRTKVEISLDGRGTPPQKKKIAGRTEPRNYSLTHYSLSENFRRKRVDKKGTSILKFRKFGWTEKNEVVSECILKHNLFLYCMRKFQIIFLHIEYENSK